MAGKRLKLVLSQYGVVLREIGWRYHRIEYGSGWPNGLREIRIQLRREYVASETKILEAIFGPSIPTVDPKPGQQVAQRPNDQEKESLQGVDGLGK